ncbi:2'-5' RNA ligase family protein [Pseudonocardia sp. KRD291]|uniref:2'-5' RNA ligase family protein n=1 Tax=Pseudonocardia sp. KRD291 TaxID=2792007 RepID=UPI001C4A1248|nr:2'-5' RNA ligase family protein [Pseudonocardia sp. KRD291]MBW0106803.1 2'-5' RNA ligase family protein [Pseudonocardia sp. KRD291]
MPHHVRFRLDDDAVAALGSLRARVRDAGIDAPSPGGDARPDVTVAAAATVPRATRDALVAELRLVALPALWLATLGSVTGDDERLVLAAVTDPEVLAVHTAVHDVLAGRVRSPSAAHLPGSWLPHVVLARSRPAEAFALLHPVRPVRARITAVELHDTRTGETDALA